MNFSTCCHADLNQRDCTLDNVSHEDTTPGTIIFTKSTMMNNDDVITCSYNCYISGHTIILQGQSSQAPSPQGYRGNEPGDKARNNPGSLNMYV